VNELSIAIKAQKEYHDNFDENQGGNGENTEVSLPVSISDGANTDGSLPVSISDNSNPQGCSLHCEELDVSTSDDGDSKKIQSVLKVWAKTDCFSDTIEFSRKELNIAGLSSLLNDGSIQNRLLVKFSHEHMISLGNAVGCYIIHNSVCKPFSDDSEDGMGEPCEGTFVNANIYFTKEQFLDADADSDSDSI
jgi:hypothetical protein